MQKIGLTGSYTSIADFREQLFNQISINVRAFLSGAPIKLDTPREIRAKVASIQKIVKQGKVYMEDYEKDGKVKSFLVKGDTKAIKEQMKEMGGRWNTSLGGWVFSKGREIEIAEFIKRNA